MTPTEAAQWMLDFVNNNGELHQQDAADKLLGYQNDKIAYYDENGYACVAKGVLQLFKKISPDVVYSRSGKYWRLRVDGDEPGRSQY